MAPSLGLGLCLGWRAGEARLADGPMVVTVTNRDSNVRQLPERFITLLPFRLQHAAFRNTMTVRRTLRVRPQAPRVDWTPYLIPHYGTDQRDGSPQVGNDVRLRNS